MKIGDKVKHKNVHIQGEIVKLEEVGETTVIDVQCENGLYYDGVDLWELVEPKEPQEPQEPQLEVDPESEQPKSNRRKGK